MKRLLMVVVLAVTASGTFGIAAPAGASRGVSQDEGLDDCDSYIAFRDLIERNAETSDLAGYAADAFERIENMEGAAGEDGDLIASYRAAIEPIAALVEGNDWRRIGGAAVVDDLVPLVDEVGFDEIEQDVWEWATSVCGALATNCRGFLAPVVGRPPLDLMYLVDPNICGGDNQRDVADELARTGTNDSLVFVIGAVLVLTGAMLVGAGRQRRRAA